MPTTAAEWLTYITNPSNLKVLGQHLEYSPGDYSLGYNEFFAPLQTAYGKMPIQPGLTIGLGSSYSTCKAALDFLKAKGFQFINFDHHPNNPWTNGDPWDTSSTDLANLNSLPAWGTELARVRDVLLYAKSIGLAGILRIFHEMNSDTSFWWDWGCAGETVAPFKAAWTYMRNYLIAAGVDNVLYNYCVLDMGWEDIWTDMAPGAGEFDLASVDVYSDTATSDGDLSVLSALGKPIGFGEIGPAGLSGDAALWLNAVKVTYPEIRFLQFWHSWPACSAALTDMSNAGTLINDASMLTTASAPIAPSGLTAAAISRTQINLAWVDNSDNEVGFKIERSLNGTSWAQIATVGAGITTYNDTGLTCGTTYYYRVCAYK